MHKARKGKGDRSTAIIHGYKETKSADGKHYGFDGVWSRGEPREWEHGKTAGDQVLTPRPSCHSKTKCGEGIFGKKR
jgi:hypothetical protein